MDVYIMVRRRKQTIFFEAKETTTVAELKLMIEGIIKVRPLDQSLYSHENEHMEDENMLQDYGINMITAKVQTPLQIGLSLKDEEGNFEVLDITPYSLPPDLPEVMKCQDDEDDQEQQQQQ